MKLCTTSETISFIRQVEEACASFYESLKSEVPEFSNFPKENKGFVTLLQRTYQSVITDAIEGCYAFNLETDEYQIDLSKPQTMAKSELIKKALEIEKKVRQLYQVSASQSKDLMADVPRVLNLIAKKRETRISSLEKLL